MPEKELAKGIFFKDPHPNAPDFVKGKISIRIEEFKKFLEEKSGDEWINLQISESRGGKNYISVDNWKPNASKAKTESYTPPSQPQPYVADDDIPF